MTATKNKFQFVETVEENLGFWDHDNRKEPKKARELYRTLSTPSLDDLKAMIQMNLMKKNSVTAEDINLAAKS